MIDKERIYRHEWKYIISHNEAEFLKQRLSNFLRLDPHAKNGGYLIRSLYFDDYMNSAYKQKLMGINSRQKWRIRIYDYSDRKIALERKKKVGNYIYKESADLTRQEFENIINSNFFFLLDKTDNLYKEFYYECTSKVLRPKVIVDYNRVPYIFEEGTVRITFDDKVRAAVGSFNIFDKNLPTLPAQENHFEILEVKYTEFIPQIIKEILPLNGSEFTAFSKYVACYEAAHHLTDITAGINKTNLNWKN